MLTTYVSKYSRNHSDYVWVDCRAAEYIGNKQNTQLYVYRRRFRRRINWLNCSQTDAAITAPFSHACLICDRTGFQIQARALVYYSV